MARLPPALRPLWPVVKRTYTAGTRAVAPLTQQVSRLRGGYLPRRVTNTIDDAVANGEARMWVARAAEEISRRAPHGVPTDNPTLRAQTHELIPRVAVAELPGGRVLGRHRAVITRGGGLLGELSEYFGTTRALEHPLFLHPFPSPPVDVEGRLGVLAARGDMGYYHFLIDVLPRIGILEQCRDVVAPDRWYVPATLPFQRELLAMMGIADASIVDSARAPHVRAESLVVPGLADSHLRTPPWLVAFLRERLLPPSAQRVPGRNIYVTRGRQRNNRIVTNEPEVLEMLSRHGFTVVDPGGMPVAEQIRAFAEADRIVAPHGGALANLAFASPGAHVVELFAPDYIQGCYWKLADGVRDVGYRYLVGVGKPPRGSGMWGVASDITVDPAVLERILEDLPARAPQLR